MRDATCGSAMPPRTSVPTEEWGPDDQPPVPPPPPARRRQWPWVLLIALVTTGIGSGVLVLMVGPRPDELQVPPAPVLSRFTEEPGFQEQPALSPDGSQLVYSDGTELYLRRVEGGRVIVLTEDFPAPARQPAWSPDGNHIAFSAAGDLYVMGALGERPRRVTEGGYGPTWSPDGRELAFTTREVRDPNIVTAFSSALWIVEVESGARRLVCGEGDHTMLDWSPRGDRIAFTGTDGVGTIRVDGTQREVVPSAWGVWSPRFGADGSALVGIVSRGGATEVRLARVDPETGAIEAPGLAWFTIPATTAWHLTRAADGRRWALSAVEHDHHLYRVELDPETARPTGPLQRITAGSQRYTCPSISPDGARVAYTSFGGYEDLFVADLATGEQHALSASEGYTRGPRWSPDGERLAFYGARGEAYGIYSVRADGGSLTRLSGPENAYLMVPVWSPDGGRMAVTDATPQPYLIDLDQPWDTQFAAQRREAAEGYFAVDWSDDGRWLALSRLDGQKARMDADSGAIEELVFGEYYWLEWMSDSRRLLMAAGDTVSVLDTETGEIEEVLSLAPGRIPGLPSMDLSADDRTLVISVDTSDADIWLADLPGEEGLPNPPATPDDRLE